LLWNLIVDFITGMVNRATRSATRSVLGFLGRSVADALPDSEERARRERDAEELRQWRRDLEESNARRNAD
jgi:hypothetical protein